MNVGGHCTHLNLGESVESGTVDRVAVGYRTARTEYTVALAVRIAQEFPHLRQHRFLHYGHHGRHFVRVHARVERVRQPLADQTVRVDAVTHVLFTVWPTRNYDEHFTVVNAIPLFCRLPTSNGDTTVGNLLCRNVVTFGGF